MTDFSVDIDDEDEDDDDEEAEDEEIDLMGAVGGAVLLDRKSFAFPVTDCSMANHGLCLWTSPVRIDFNVDILLDWAVGWALAFSDEIVESRPLVASE